MPDWNNEHPVSGGEWYETVNVDVNGGQIPLRSWTNFWDNRSVFGKVAYGYGCFDSPFHFNLDMDCQQQALDYFRPAGWNETLA